jgi:outer membrane protein
MEGQPQMNAHTLEISSCKDKTLRYYFNDMFTNSKRKLKVLSLLGGLLLGSSLWAQGPMSLRECIDYGLKHHSLNTISNNEIAIAKQRVREGLSGYLPQVNGQVAIDDNLIRPTTVIPAGTFGPEEIRVQFGNQYNTNATVQLDQVVYDRSMLLGLKALDPYADLAVLNKEKNEQSLMYGIAMSYYGVQIYMEQAQLLKDNETKFQKMADVLKLQVDQGVARKIDYDRIALTVANLKSQQQVIDNEIELSVNRLKNAMGMALNEPLEVQGGEWRKEDALNVNGPVAGTGRVMDLYIQQKQITMQELDIRRKQAMYLPTLSLYGRVGAQAFGDKFFKSYENWYGFASIGLNLRVPIWNSFRTDAGIKQSQLTLSSARENMRMTKNNIALQQTNAETQWRNAQTNLETNKQNIALAKDMLDVTQLQVEKGVATLSDLLNADYAYKEAQTNYVTSLLKVLTARLEYELAQGTLQTFLLQ